MEPIQASVVPETLTTFLPRLANDFRAAISYVSFYPADSSFVIQSVQRLYENFQKILQCEQSLVIRVKNEKLYINGLSLSSFDDLLHLFRIQKIQGVKIEKDISVQELNDWLQIIAFSFDEDIKDFEKNKMNHIRPIVKWNAGSSTAIAEEPMAFAMNVFESFDTLTQRSHSSRIDGFHQNHQALLGFVSESWQFIQTQRKKHKSSSEIAYWAETFDRLFQKLLDQMETPSPDFKDTSHCFKTPPESFLDEIEGLFSLEK